MKFSLVVAAAAASQVSIRNLYKLSAHDLLPSGATCTPPTGTATNPCASGLACTGATNSGAAATTKSCATALAQLDAGATCTPAVGDAADPCGAGKTCSGATNSGAAATTKSCVASLAKLDAGATCTPAVGDAADPCGTG